MTPSSDVWSVLLLGEGNDAMKQELPFQRLDYCLADNEAQSSGVDLWNTQSRRGLRVVLSMV